MTNEMQFTTIILDGGGSLGFGLLPWLSMLIVPIIAIRSLFLIRCKNSDKTERIANRCFRVLHLQSAFCMVTSVWLSLGFWLYVIRHFQHETDAFYAMQNITLSHTLWAVAFQCFIATVGALVVATCSGVHPRLWQPRYTITSIALCAVAQAISYGVFVMGRN